MLAMAWCAEFVTDAAVVHLVYPSQKFVPPSVRAFIAVATEGAAAIANRAGA